MLTLDAVSQTFPGLAQSGTGVYLDLGGGWGDAPAPLDPDCLPVLCGCPPDEPTHPPQQSYTGLFALIPVLLALEWGPIVVALGSAPLLLLAATDIFGVNHTTITSLIIRSVGVAVGVGIGAHVSSYREHHATVLSLSRAATEAAEDAILPRVPSSIGSYRFSCLYRSAASESLIGGDFYKVTPTDFGVRLIIGDVRGKGLEAIALVSAVPGCFREWAPETTSLKHLVARLDARVVDKGTQSDFVTAVVARSLMTSRLRSPTAGTPRLSISGTGDHSGELSPSTAPRRWV